MSESDKKSWDGNWDSKEGLEIKLKWKKEEEFTELKTKFTNWILDRILLCLSIIWTIFLLLIIVFTNFATYAIESFIIYFKSLSPIVKIFYISTLMLLLAFLLYCCLYTAQEDSK